MSSINENQGLVVEIENTLSNLTPDERLQMVRYDEYQEQKLLKEQLYFELLSKDKLYMD